MCVRGDEPGYHDPEVVKCLKGLAERIVSGTRRVACGHKGIAAEHWLEDGRIRSRYVPAAGQAASSMAAFEAAAHSGLKGPVPKLESEPGGKEFADLDGVGIANQDETHSSGAVICKSLLERVNAELATPNCPECGKKMEQHLNFGKSFTSRLGSVKVGRTHCRCRYCGCGFLLLDRTLGLEG